MRIICKNCIHGLYCTLQDWADVRENDLTLYSPTQGCTANRWEQKFQLLDFKGNLI